MDQEPAQNLFVAGGASPSGNCGFVFGGHHPGHLRKHHRPAGQRGHPQNGAGGQPPCFYNGGKVTKQLAASDSPALTMRIIINCVVLVCN